MDENVNAINKELEHALEQQMSQDGLDAKYLAFRLDGQLYGISIAGVISILQVQPTTSMPELPHYVKGIINLRGNVLPILDINMRFGKPEKEYTDRTCFVIVSIEGTDVGLVVDEVQEVLTVGDDRIAPPPTGTEGNGRYVSGIAKLEQGMMLILDCKRILSDSDLGSFSL